MGEVLLFKTLEYIMILTTDFWTAFNFFADIFGEGTKSRLVTLVPS